MLLIHYGNCLIQSTTNIIIIIIIYDKKKYIGKWFGMCTDFVYI